ncbi:hypothetical protein TcCL_Unassigned05686, partial [Trypanosoma cruzi]
MPGSDAIVSCIRNVFSRDLPKFMKLSVGSYQPSSTPIHSTKLSKASLTCSSSCCQHWYAHRRSKTTPEAPSFHIRVGHVVTSNAQKPQSSSIGNWGPGEKCGKATAWKGGNVVSQHCREGVCKPPNFVGRAARHASSHQD